MFSFLVAICIILGIFISCKDSDEISQAESSEPSAVLYTSDSESSEVSLIEDQSELSEVTISEPQIKTPAEKMVEGEVRTTADKSKSPDENIRPLLNWYCINMVTVKNNFTKVTYLGSEDFNNFADFTFTFAAYELENNNSYVVDYITILFGSFHNLPDEYILIDGKETLNEYYPMEIGISKIKVHGVFGKYSDKYTAQSLTKPSSELDIASLIGAGRNIYKTIAISDTTVAVISVLNNADLKIDFIDITKGQLAYKSHQLTDITAQGYSFPTNAYVYYSRENYFIINLYVKKLSNNEDTEARYEVTIDSEGNINDTLITNSDDYRISSVHSPSGRYETFYKNYDLYIYDNTTNTDTLVYDAKPDDESIDHDIGEYKGASGAFFADEKLYFTIMGWEWVIGTAMYDPETKKVVLYENNFCAANYKDGYIYGYHNIGNYEDEYGRFNINEPDKIEVLIEYNFEMISYYIVYSLDCEYLMKSTPKKYYSDIKVEENFCSVVVYDTETFKEIGDFYLNPETKYENIILVSDYVYFTAEANSKAYVIKIK